MVDALNEAARVLAPGGALLDVRPISGKYMVDVVTASAATPVASIEAYGATQDDLAADAALRQALEEPWLRLRDTIHFGFEFYWNTVTEMEASVRESRRMKDAHLNYAEIAARQRELGGRIRCTRTMVLHICSVALPEK